MPQLQQPEPTTPRLSVVLPVRNEERHIARVLGELQAQTIPRDQVEFIVVDGMSTDRTRAVVEQLQRDDPRIRLLDNPSVRSGPARNVGAYHANAPYVLFVDGHCRILSPSMLADVLAAFENGARCVSRPQPLLAEAGDDFQTAAALARNSFLGHNTGSLIYNDGDSWCSPLSAGCGYETALYRELGGVDEDFDAGEDLEFNLRVERAGVQARHSDAFAVGYLPRGDLVALFRQIYRYGYGRARMARKHSGGITPAAVALSLLSLLALGLPVLGLAHPWAWWAFGLLGLVHGAAVFVAAGQATLRRRPDLFATVVLCLLAIHHGAGLGYASGWLGGPPWTHAPREARHRDLQAS